jgi:hypothetical protein
MLAMLGLRKGGNKNLRRGCSGTSNAWPRSTSLLATRESATSLSRWSHSPLRTTWAMVLPRTLLANGAKRSGATPKMPTRNVCMLSPWTRAVLRDLERVAKKHKFAGYERIRNVSLKVEPFTSLPSRSGQWSCPEPCWQTERRGQVRHRKCQLGMSALSAQSTKRAASSSLTAARTYSSSPRASTSPPSVWRAQNLAGKRSEEVRCDTENAN